MFIYSAQNTDEVKRNTEYPLQASHNVGRADIAQRTQQFHTSEVSSV